MTLAELYAALEKVENGEALRDAVKVEINRLNEESKGHREGKEKAETSLKELTTKFDALTKEHASLQKGADTSSNEVTKLQNQMDELLKKYNEVETARKDAEAKRVQSEIMAQTVDALTKGNAMDPQEFAKLIAPQIVVQDDGSYGYKKADGTMGTIQDGANEWLANKPWAVKNTQKAGSGEPNSAPQGENDEGAVTK